MRPDEPAATRQQNDTRLVRHGEEKLCTEEASTRARCVRPQAEGERTAAAGGHRIIVVPAMVAATAVVASGTAAPGVGCCGWLLERQVGVPNRWGMAQFLVVNFCDQSK